MSKSAAYAISMALDSLVGLWVFVSGFICLWDARYYEASALIVAGVFWQRAWKESILKEARETLNAAKFKRTNAEAPHE